MPILKQGVSGQGARVRDASVQSASAMAACLGRVRCLCRVRLVSGFLPSYLFHAFLTIPPALFDLFRQQPWVAP